MLKDLILIIGGCLIMGVGMYISDWRRKKQEERQARLNSRFTLSPKSNFRPISEPELEP